MGIACDLGAYEFFETLMGAEFDIPEIEEPETMEIITPEPMEEEPPDFPDWWWKFEGYVCSESNLTEMFISTDVDPELFSLTINDRPVKCYQQSYDETRYWCHVELVMLEWDTPTNINFCVENACQEIQRTTLSQERCEGDQPITEPEPQACSAFVTEDTCNAEPGCLWYCANFASANVCSCLGEE
jgi:hypothetical protein